MHTHGELVEELNKGAYQWKCGVVQQDQGGILTLIWLDSPVLRLLCLKHAIDIDVWQKRGRTAGDSTGTNSSN